MGCLKSYDQIQRAPDRSEHTALHFDHVQSSPVISCIGCASAVLEQETLEATIVRFTHGRVNADVGRDARENQMGDPAHAKDHFKVGRVEAAFAGLIDHELARARGKLRNDLPARLATHQNTPQWAGVANSCTDLSAPPVLIKG